MRKGNHKVHSDVVRIAPLCSVCTTDETRPLHSKPPAGRSVSSIKRDVKKKVLPRPEGEKILSRDPAHFTVRVPLATGASVPVCPDPFLCFVLGVGADSRDY